MMTFRTITALADCFNHEHQSRGPAHDEVLASLARRMADCIEDPIEREYFLDIASWSGLDVADVTAP